MALIDNLAAAEDPRVIAQVTSAILAAAQNIYTEASPPTNHAARAAFATKVVTGQQNFTPLIESATCFASLSSTSTDTSVNNAVATLWNTWAGA